MEPEPTPADPPAVSPKNFSVESTTIHKKASEIRDYNDISPEAIDNRASKLPYGTVQCCAFDAGAQQDVYHTGGSNSLSTLIYISLTKKIVF